MEQLYYILDTETNEILVDNLNYDEGIEWLIQNGIATRHAMLPKENEI